MPKVLLLSDSHGLTEEVTTIKYRHMDEVDKLIHCGDSELSEDSQELSQYIKVAGNCDLDGRYPDEQQITVDDLSFFATHGHLFQVKSSLMPLSYRADELGAKVVCFGHTHIAGAERVGDKLFINPGSIRLPRVRKEGTYAIVTWKDHDIVVEFFDVNGKRVDDLTYETTLE
ncbi:metallophosphoesterase family protein [Aquibacillus sediminis]|uniref:metallophosphoesterase family protein n=1 Tax=Aquibacillus sediminis TaxID=2574734 RepID=UPI001108A316|nr:metallophosphoesterase [Aquibacillus sediminis]